MLQFFTTGWLLVGVPVATSLLCLTSVLGIASLNRMNRGAKVNIAWSLIAVGLLAFGAAEMDRVLMAFDLPNLNDLRDLVRLFGALLILVGVAVGRALLRRLVK